MIYEEIMLREQMFNKIEDNSTVAIFGACPAGKCILEDIKKYKKNVKVVSFIDNFVKGTFENLPVYNLKEFIDKKITCDTVIMSTLNKIYASIHILRMYKYNVLEQTRFIYNYYRFYKEKLPNIIGMFKEQDDRDLYNLILSARIGLEEKSKVTKYYNTKFPTNPDFTILSRHYIDKINKNAVKTIFDLGFNSGLNAVAYNKFLPNLEHIYGFDAIYTKCADTTIESFINNEKLKIIEKCVGEEKGETKFVINKNLLATSCCADISSKTNVSFENEEVIYSEVITLDDFCEENNVYPDLIKTDIEGAELSALKGAIKTIKRVRPQLAISIYHTITDFIEIPLYLKENLENYTFKLEHYRGNYDETVLYAIPNELN